MYYLKAFINSFYNFSWLKDQRKSGKNSANYVMLFLLLFSLVHAIYFSSFIPKELTKIRDEVFAGISDFRAEMKNGELFVYDIEQPFIYEAGEGDEHFKVVIDTTSTEPISIEEAIDMEKENGILITRDTFSIYEQEKGKTTVQDLKDIPNAEFTREYLVNWSNKFLARRFVFFAFALVGTFVGFAVGKLTYLIILSLVASTIVLFAQKKYKFSEVYTIGLYAITGPSIVVSLLMLIGHPVRYLYSILVLVLLVGALLSGGKSEEVVSPPEKQP